MITVSVVMPVLNEGPLIEQAIVSARNAGAAEIVVVDGGSQDDTLPRSEQLADIVLRGPQCRAIQQNLGAAAAAGDVLLFLHADTELPATALRQIHEALSHSRTGYGAFRQRIDGDSFAYRLIERGNAFRAGIFGRPYGDQGIFVRRGLFEKVGGFPEVKLMEETGLARRLRRHARCRVLPGPLRVSARHWETRGVIRQTIRNQFVVWAEFLGVLPDRLADVYHRNGGAAPGSSALDAGQTGCAATRRDIVRESAGFSR